MSNALHNLNLQLQKVVTMLSSISPAIKENYHMLHDEGTNKAQPHQNTLFISYESPQHI
jgi:hypothetical protein